MTHQVEEKKMDERTNEAGIINFVPEYSKYPFWTSALKHLHISGCICLL